MKKKKKSRLKFSDEREDKKQIFINLYFPWYKAKKPEREKNNFVFILKL